MRFGKLSFEIDWCQNKKPVRKHRTGSSASKNFRAGREKQNLRRHRESFRLHYCVGLNCHRLHDYRHRRRC